MMRKLALGLAILAVLAPSTSAKGVRLVRVEIAGPGLHEPISLKLSRMPDGVAPLPWDLLPGEHGFVSKVPEGELGPGYLVTTYTRWINDREPVVHRQTVFPFAPGAPVTYTDPYRRPFTETEWIEEPGGWSRLPDLFEQWFVDQGVPRPSPATTLERGPLLEIVTIAVAAAMLFALGMRRMRRRGTLSPA